MGVYDNILAKDWGMGASNLIDLSEYEARFPLLPQGDHDDLLRDPRRRPSQSRLTGRRPSSRSRMSRSSTKQDAPLTQAEIAQMTKKGKHKKKSDRPESRTDRPNSRSPKGREISRSGSVRSMNRTNSSDSVASHSSMASVASNYSRKSGR